jgi:peptidoglycan/LPS O-acetylase OafA/YrhL
LLSLFIVGGSVALRGPFVLQHSWPIVYGIQAILAAALLYVVTRYGAPWLGAMALVAMVLAACVSELVVLLIIHPILADELTPGSTLFYWLLATGGPLQPVAACIGGLLALRQSQRRMKPSPSGSRESTTKVE